MLFGSKCFYSNKLAMFSSNHVPVVFYNTLNLKLEHYPKVPKALSATWETLEYIA